MDVFGTIRDIFYSGGHAFTGNLDSINEIAFLVNEGYLKYQTVSIARKSEYLALASNNTMIERADLAAGGGSTHVALKMLVGTYLKQQRSRDVVYEHEFCGYFPDVLTADHTIVAECGHTQNPEKTLVYFKQGGVQECIQIPYPDVDDTTVFGYCFAAGKDLNDFLTFLEAEERNKIKKLIRNTQ
ncbi:MAG: hypothetical protein Q7S08_01485 [bacterium]|nr:hypothetical protein [bacterium]